MTSGPNLSTELRAEAVELRKRFDGPGFDVVLTNPPFAKEYERTEAREAAVLDGYVVGFDGKGGSRKPRARLRSSVMFLERYHDLLKPGGQLITVIDDSVLGGSSYAWARDYLRENFLVRAVVSLPGDAFQRSKARVKTSLIVLEKRRTKEEPQPSVFMYYATAVGVDDSPRERAVPADRRNRELASKEIDKVAALYEQFLAGHRSAARWTVDASRISDRMDVKGCLLQPRRRVRKWRRNGLEVEALHELVDVVFPRPKQVEEAESVLAGEADPDLILCADSDEVVTRLRVRYDGFADRGETVRASDSTASALFRVHEGDVVISHINAVHGAICVVPRELDGAVVSNEYTVCRARKIVDPQVLWMLLRTPEIRAELLLLSTGIGRSRVRWDSAGEVAVPLPPDPLAREVMRNVRKADKKEREARALRQDAERRLVEEIGLDSQDAARILAAFKPPR